MTQFQFNLNMEHLKASIVLVLNEFMEKNVTIICRRQPTNAQRFVKITGTATMNATF
ncbi:hypothetical protein J1TS3_44000 [Siminovitchia fordii]|uniref:Uncharacterized protein n=1 Tax=Siminovitchia fordii TaxID=254759 RepID=A0ABQ4KC05_9BACI|nr:hypothetical protein [Siminovitchia fordii]GIN23266.1 hypothetical protein J1TS3_44000 [Siminovitchia fordii]